MAITCDLLCSLGQDVGLEEVASAASRITISTSFSGIGAPEQAHSASCAAMSALLGRVVSPGRHYFAIEVNKECQYELQMAPASPECLFCEMLDSVLPNIRRAIVTNLLALTYDDMRRIFSTPCIMAERMPCVKHNTSCEVKRAQLHVAGTECIAWSSQGQRQGLNDRRIVIFMAWAAQRRQIQEELVLHENVPQFPPSCLQQLLGYLHIVREQLSVVLNARDFGNPYERSRRWTFLIHKGSMRYSPARSKLLPNWAELLVASAQPFSLRVFSGPPPFVSDCSDSRCCWKVWFWTDVSLGGNAS